MELFILRHADAGFDAASDFERQLTAKGETQSRKVGEFLKANGLKPDLVLSSPFVRARETAEIVAQRAGLDSPLIEDTLGCGMSPEDAAAMLRGYKDNFEKVLIVGHNPDLQDLAEWFLGIGDGSVRVRKASLMHLELMGLSRGTGVLEFFLPVRYVS